MQPKIESAKGEASWIMYDHGHSADVGRKIPTRMGALEEVILRTRGNLIYFQPSCHVSCSL